MPVGPESPVLAPAITAAGATFPGPLKARMLLSPSFETKTSPNASVSTSVGLFSAVLAPAIRNPAKTFPLAGSVKASTPAIGELLFATHRRLVFGSNERPSG